MEEKGISRRQGLAAMGVAMGATLFGSEALAWAKSPASGGVPNQYSVSIKNSSARPRTTFAIFAELPNSSSYKNLRLAWQTKTAASGTTAMFSWPIAWGFSFSESQVVKGGIWQTSGTLEANPDSDSTCAAILDYRDDAYELSPDEEGTTAENLDEVYVTTTDRIPELGTGGASFGLTLNGSPCAFSPAEPSVTANFVLHPTYYLVAGTYKAGQMVDVAVVNKAYELAFTGSTRNIKVELGNNNKFRTLK